MPGPCRPVTAQRQWAQFQQQHCLTVYIQRFAFQSGNNREETTIPLWNDSKFQLQSEAIYCCFFSFGDRLQVNAATNWLVQQFITVNCCIVTKQTAKIINLTQFNCKVISELLRLIAVLLPF